MKNYKVNYVSKTTLGRGEDEIKVYYIHNDEEFTTKFRTNNLDIVDEMDDRSASDQLLEFFEWQIEEAVEEAIEEHEEERYYKSL